MEVQIDGGEWVATVLRTPPLSALTWVQGCYDWPAARSRHTFRVRATDETEARQSGEDHDPYPSGATGYHSVTVTI